MTPAELNKLVGLQAKARAVASGATFPVHMKAGHPCTEYLLALIDAAPSLIEAARELNRIKKRSEG